MNNLYDKYCIVNADKICVDLTKYMLLNTVYILYMSVCVGTKLG